MPSCILVLVWPWISNLSLAMTRFSLTDVIKNLIDEMITKTFHGSLLTSESFFQVIDILRVSCLLDITFGAR